ncbi:hypothetical protein PLICRDRAFT_496088 [Plicaturopsis crispa FD-325 SS-3]|nr:hypothetical protein PLICRDRAFT_496088 [Plicaturopsis crispa FD-325 SS-3]
MGRGGRNHSKPTGNDASTALPPKPATECKEIDRREGKCKPLKGKAPKVPVKPSEPTLDSKAEAQRDCAERLSSVSELERRKEKGKGRETEAADHDRNGVRKRTVDCAVSSTNANSSRTPSEPLPSQNQTTKRFTSLGVVVSCPTSVLNVGDPKPIVAANVQAGPSHDSVKDTAEAVSNFCPHLVDVLQRRQNQQ